MDLTHAADNYLISRPALIVALAYMAQAVLLTQAEQDNAVTVIWVITTGKVRTETFQAAAPAMQDTCTAQDHAVLDHVADLD
jgi:hypothetical protein